MYLTRYLLTEPLGDNQILLVNCLSGAVDFIEKQTHKALVKDEFYKLPQKIINSLVGRGYLFRSREEELAVLKNLETKYNTVTEERFIDFVVAPTFDCNLACPYCFQKELNQGSVYLTEDSVPHLISALAKMSSLFQGKKAIQLFGGEPLLPKNKPFIKELLSYAYVKDLPVAITTNGTTILQYKELIKKYRDLIKVVQITIDGPPEIHNKRRIPKNGKPTFSLIIKGIEFLLSAKIGVNGRVNVDKTNISSLPKLARLLKKRGLFKEKSFKCSLAPVANHCSKNQPSDLLSENQLLQEIQALSIKHVETRLLSCERIPKIIKHLESAFNGSYSSPRFNYCQANRNGYFIFAPDGLIYPCSEAAGHRELAIGQFLPSFMLDQKKLSVWSERTILSLKKCKNCNIAPLCGGGCTYAAYGINGNLSKPFCQQAEKVVQAYLKTNKYQLFSKAKKAS